MEAFLKKSFRAGMDFPNRSHKEKNEKFDHLEKVKFHGNTWENKSH